MRARIWDRARLSHVTVGCFPPGPGACAGCCSGGFDCGQTCHISWGARTCNSSIDPLRHTHAVYLTIMCTRARSRRPRRPRTCHAGAGSIQEPGGRHRPPPCTHHATVSHRALICPRSCNTSLLYQFIILFVRARLVLRFDLAISRVPATWALSVAGQAINVFKYTFHGRARACMA